MIEGVLVVDKPAGPTSHDLVALARRAFGERRIGHTGTLDPFATGVLPLACGRATRLVRFLASDKAYEARLRFGFATDTYDVTGTVVRRTGAHPDLAAVERALASLRGGSLQTPPPYSAKKVGGRRAYDLARGGAPVALAPAPVRLSVAEIVGFSGDTAEVRIVCSSGFYVRSFAHAVGELVGTGACLDALRRTRSGEFGLDEAVTVETIATDPQRAAARIRPLDRLLTDLPAVVVTAAGRDRVAHGRAPEPSHVASSGGAPPDAAGGGPVGTRGWIRVVDADGSLIAIAAEEAGGALHPSVVLI